MKHPKSDQLHHFFNAGYDLIPLNQYEAIGKNGQKVGKVPIGGKWQEKPALTLEEAKAHMASGGNVGIRLQRRDLVIDVDPRNFEHGINSFNELVAAYPELEPFTQGLCRVAIQTGGRTEDDEPGYHFYFRLRFPKDWDERDRLSTGLKGFPGIEFKSIGSQVLAIGSVHPDTELHYEWELANEMLPDMAVIPVIPDELFRDLWKHPASKGAVMEGADWTNEMLAEYLAEIDPTDYRFKHDPWMTLMMGCHAATLGDGIDEFALWSIRDEQYAHDYDLTRYRWDTLDVDGDVTVKTLEYIARDKKINVPRRPDADFADTLDEDKDLVVAEPEGILIPHMNKTGDKIKDTKANALQLVDRIVKKEGWKIRFNELHRQVEITGDSLPWETRQYPCVNEQLINNKLWLIVNAYFPQFKFDRGISPDHIAFALNILAQEDSYNPLTEYLGALEWDGKPRVEHWFTDRLGADDTELMHGASALFFRALVARAYHPGTKYDMLMILEGNQGSGKSSALKALCPNEDWFTDHPFELGGRGNAADAVLPFLGKWIHEFPEVSTLTPATMNKAKAMISKPVDSFRRPYGRGFEDAPRGFVTVGSTNDNMYLNDMTGNRRFLPIALDNRMIDIKIIADERDQLFAEAAHLYHEAPHTPLHLPSELWTAAADEADSRQADHPWVDILEAYLEGRTRIASIELFPQVGIKGIRGSTETRTLAGVMRKLGWSHRKAIRIPADELDEHLAMGLGIKKGKSYVGYVLDMMT